jgi:hypothetical protein
MSGEPGTQRLVAVANGDYAELAKLDRAVPDAQELVDLMRRHEFDARLLPDQPRGALLDAIDEALAERSSPKGTLVLSWIGHGKLGPDGRLRLMGRTTGDTDAEVAAAAHLGEWATRTGASQILVILDCCFSGQALPDTIATASAVLAGRADVATAWFCCIAASRGDEPARSGALAQEIVRLLVDGPAGDEQRQQWSLYAKRIPGNRLVEALLAEWPEERQVPQQATTGNPLPMLPNPLWNPTARDSVVEHLLQAARGTSTSQNFFTGREEILSRIVAWLRQRQPGLCVVTGPPGSGKSALVGRVATLSAPALREQLLLEGVPAELDPGESSVDATAHLRQVTVTTAGEELASQIGLPAGAGAYDVLAHASRCRAEGRPLAIALDGLDEAGDLASRAIALELIVPLSREALVLVATREVPGPVGEPSLLATLAPAAETIDLGQDAEHILRDVHSYAVRRLEGASPTMDAQAVADALVEISRAAGVAHEGPFLFARLVTSQLRAEPVDTAGDDWRSRLASSVETAFEADLSRCVLEIDGYEHPTAARELMLALACAYGRGFPPDDVWPAVATAISPTGAVYGRDSVFALLFALGRHVVTGTEGDQAVFRIAHQRMIDYLRPTVGVSPWQSLSPMIAEPTAHAILALYERLLDEGQNPSDHTYLWRFAWQHLADAGLAGIDLLRRLVDRDREAFLPDLAIGMLRVAHVELGSGDPRDAASLLEECVEIFGDLDQPAERAAALSQLAVARNLTGDAAGADAAAEQALQLVRSNSDKPGGRHALGMTLLAQALAQLRQGLLRAALGAATEAIEVFEAETADGNDCSEQLASTCVLASSAAFGLGDVEQVDALSQRALDVLEHAGAEDYMMIEALAGRAQAEMLRVMAGRGPSADPRESAGARIAELYRRSGATGTIADTMLAEGLRTYAVTLLMLGLDDETPPAPQQLLDDAIDLVRETASVSCDAALALAAALTVRAGLDADEAEKEADLDAAEQALRPYAASSPSAAVQLGMAISRAVALRAAVSDGDSARLIQRLEEAVDLLSAFTSTLARAARCDALELLYGMLMAAGREDEGIFALESSANDRRELSGLSLASQAQAAASLAELAGRIASTRPLEAIEYGTEAARLLEAAGSDGQELVHVLAELNVGAANASLQRWEVARGHLEQALALLDDLPASPVVAQLRAAALTNVTTVRLDADEIEAAVDGARLAVELLEEHGPGLNPGLMARARLNLGLALQASGDPGAAAGPLDVAIAELREQAGQPEEAIVPLALALNAAGDDVWDAVMTQLEDEPEFARAASVLRRRPPGQMASDVQDVQRALSAAEPDQLMLIRQLVRTRRREDPVEFDAAWTAAGEVVQDWMTIPLETELTVLAWWNTPTWRQSRDYLLGHPEILTPVTDTILEELRGKVEAALLERHLELRADAEAHGVEHAYAPVLADLLLDEWFEAGLDDDFLAQHHMDLLSPEVADAAAARAAEGEHRATVANAILVLARRGEDRVAYRVRNDPAFGVTLLEPAWRSVDFERLAAVATLCRDAASPEDEKGRLATVAQAIAMALTGGRDAALDMVGQLAEAELGPSELAPLSAAVSDALTYHPEHHEALIALLQALRGGSAGAAS